MKSLLRVRKGVFRFRPRRCGSQCLSRVRKEGFQLWRRRFERKILPPPRRIPPGRRVGGELSDERRTVLVTGGGAKVCTEKL